MIKFVIKDHLLKLTNAEWANLKKRFNPENVVLVGRHNYEIKIPCRLCARYQTKKGLCSACPFYVLSSKDNACLDLIGTMFPAQAFHVNVKHIRWSSSDNYTARRQLRALQRRMREIEKLQKGKR